MSLEDTMIDKFNTLITAAFGLVAALAWNEAIKSFITSRGWDSHGPWVYAVGITVLAVLVTIVLGKLSERAKKLDIDNKILARLKKTEKIKSLRKKLKKKK